MTLSDDFKSKEKTIEITKKDMESLNRRIKEEIDENQSLKKVPYELQFQTNKQTPSMEKDR